MISSLPLEGVRVLEHGNRVAVTACGSVLAALGARVSFVARERFLGARVPPVHVDGKQAISPADSAAVGAALDASDVVIASSDSLPDRIPSGRDARIVCDITAYGSSGPLAGIAHSDALLQAASGLAETTGEPAGAPTLCSFAQLEGLAALYAAAGIVTALYARATTGVGQSVEIAMFDCAFTTLTTFLPFHLTGRPVTRSGNRHVLASPWNIYRAADGWLLICTGSDEQWQRLCEVIGDRALAGDPRLRTAPDRVQHRAIVDAAVQAWIARLAAADAANALQARGVAAGAVVGAAALEREPNIAHRGVYSAAGFRSAIRYLDASHAANDRTACVAPSMPWPADPFSVGPLAGLKVLEVGQYTTAPLVARNLGALGANVLKVEPPGGDATRAWPPHRDGQGFFFVLSNSDKRSLSLDLRTGTDRGRFAALLRDADVLVENLKPGSLDKLGFDAAARRRLNPGLVYCAISGFGADAAYPGRPAFDTVIQAMAGIMDLVRTDEVPQKTGISYADILGGSFALVATVAALYGRRRGCPQHTIDISMQDAAAWITQWRATAESATPRARIVRCADGDVAIQDRDGTLPRAVAAATQVTRAALLAQFATGDIDAVAVATIDEVARSAQAQARGLLQTATDSAGRDWPIFANPIRLSGAPRGARRAIGPLGECNSIVFR